MSFAGREYLEEPYQMLRPEILEGNRMVLLKSPQAYCSEMLICAVLSLAGELGWRVMYVLDKHSTRQRFVGDRIDKPLRRVPHYRALLEDANGTSNLSLKDFGQGVISFVGSNVESEFIEFSADLVVEDEYDQCDHENLPMAEDRLMAAESKGALVQLSSATHAGWGIDAAFKESDQRRYCFPCPECDEYSPIDWDGSIARWVEDDWELIDDDWHEELERDIHVFCRRCLSQGRRVPIDRSMPGRWVAQNPRSKVIGYHLPKLIEAAIPIRKMWDGWQESKDNAAKRQNWFNKWPGVGHSESGSQLSPDLLDHCRRDYRMPQESAGPCVAGIDVGKVLHVWITDESEFPSRTVFCATMPVKFREVTRILRAYAVKHVVFDADPEKTLVRDWCRKLRKMRVAKAWRCRYMEDEPAGMAIDFAKHLVKADRTMSLDDSHEDFTADEPRVLLPGDLRTLDEGKVVEQLCRPIRVIEERRGRMTSVWKKNPPEDYRHAANYCHLARKLLRRFGGSGSGGIRGGGSLVFGGQVKQPSGTAGPPGDSEPPEDTPKRRRRGFVGGA